MVERLLKKQNMTKYRLAVEAGIPHATLNDICSGKTRLENACQLALDHISQPGYKNIKMKLQSNQDLKDKNDNVQSECDMHAFVRGKDYYGGRNNG